MRIDLSPGLSMANCSLSRFLGAIGHKYCPEVVWDIDFTGPSWYTSLIGTILILPMTDHCRICDLPKENMIHDMEIAEVVNCNLRIHEFEPSYRYFFWLGFDPRPSYRELLEIK